MLYRPMRIATIPQIYLHPIFLCDTCYDATAMWEKTWQ
jgi:hypothetical protein